MSVIEIDNTGSLRILTDDDMETVLNWRNSDSIRKFMYNQHIISRQEHSDWWNKQKQDSKNSHFMFNFNGIDSGVVSFNQVDEESQSSFWAFYADPSGARGTGFRMEFLALELFFSTWQQRKLNCEVLSHNSSVLKLHAKFGFEEEGLFVDHKSISSELFSIHRLALFQNKWFEMRDKLRQRICNLGR